MSLILCLSRIALGAILPKKSFQKWGFQEEKKMRDDRIGGGYRRRVGGGVQTFCMLCTCSKLIETPE